MTKYKIVKEDRRIGTPDLEFEINKLAKEGWKLHSIIYPTFDSNMAIMERD